MAFAIPTVTVDDLREFHAKHFPNAPVPQQYLSSVQDETEYAEEFYEGEDDALGYYDDGIKRTLTDEQIAIFRHSEIQAILRQRRLQRENDDSSPDHDSEGMTTRSQIESIVPDSADSSSPHALLGPQRTETPRNDLVEKALKPQWTKSGPKTKARNKRNRKKNRERKKEMRLEMEAKKNAARIGNDEESDEWDPWRQATGPDAQKEDAVDLDY